MSEARSKRFWVRGRVQGVYFRASTRAQAERLGLDGYARNLADGRVEVLARGGEEALAALESWLWQGPPQARVDEVLTEDAEQTPEPGFRAG